jgi:hypothetical protein
MVGAGGEENSRAESQDIVQEPEQAIRKQLVKVWDDARCSVMYPPKTVTNSKMGENYLARESREVIREEARVLDIRVCYSAGRKRRTFCIN